MEEILKRSLSSMLGATEVQVRTEVSKKRKICPDETKKLERTMHLLYTASRIRIYKIADKIASSRIGSDVPLREEREIPIPRANEWDFELGDKVRIKLPLAEFKSVQKRTLGWGKRLHSVYGKMGIITKMTCKESNSPQVYTPENFSTSSLYPGVLEKDFSEDKDSIPSQWKTDDYVTLKEDPAIVQILQRRRDTIPAELFGKRGRVIAVTRAAVIVTFDEKSSYDLNSYLLTRSRDQTPLSAQKVKHPKGFELGQRVKMIKNIKRLIKNQDGNGGWNSSMTTIVGKEVTVVDVLEDGTLKVQPESGKPWRVSPDSVMHSEDLNPEEEDDVDFVPGDIVKVKIPQDVRLLLNAANIPAAFLEYLKNTAKLSLVDDDLDYLISYDQDQNVSAFASTIQKATPEEKSRHQELESMTESFQVGQEVYLDVGPPNYVTSVLRQVNAEQEVVMALTNAAKLLGFAEDNRAVIEYKNGNRYKVKKKFLTAPDKFDIKEIQQGMGSDTIKEIQVMVTNCVQAIHRDKGDVSTRTSSVGIISMLSGDPPAVDLRIHSTLASPEEICKYLKENSRWHVDGIGDTLFVSKLNSFSEVIKIGFYFNNECYVERVPQIKIPDSAAEEVVKVCEGVPAKGAAEPIPEEEIQPPALRLQQPLANQPTPTRPIDFRYMVRYEASVGANVLIPYLMVQEQQVPAAVPADVQPQQSRSVVYNIDKVDSINNN